MENRFTEPARRAVLRAQRLAIKEQQTQIGSIHLLLALLHGDQTSTASEPASHILQRKEITRDLVLNEIHARSTLRICQLYHQASVSSARFKSVRSLANPTLVAQITRLCQEREPERFGIIGTVMPCRTRYRIAAGLVREIEKQLADKQLVKTTQENATRPAPVLSDEVKRSIELAAQEARRTHRSLGVPPYIGTGHLLLGLLHNKECEAAQMLNEMGLELNKARLLLNEYLQAQGENEQAA
jgi:ATP-dependent Clp protease ATP-binding subunit ClpA